MTPELLAIILSVAWQTAGLVLLGVLIYRQTKMLDHMATHFSAGEAAIFLDQRKLHEVYEQMAETLREFRGQTP